jgi:hypothetical protein
MQLCTLIILFISLTSSPLMGKEYAIFVHPSKVDVIHSNVKKTTDQFQSEFGLSNFCNLSFFDPKGAIPPYKYESIIVNRVRNRWGLLCIDDVCEIKVSDGVIPNKKFVVSGYPILIQNYSELPFQKTSFTKRACPRTAIGIMRDGTLLIYINTSITMTKLQKVLMKYRCESAINVDGGGSTFLYIEGQKIFGTTNRKYPDVLSWETERKL